MMWLNKFVIALSLCCVVLDITLEVDARCVCNAKGTDYCQGCSGSPTTIVRPKPKYYDNNPDINLNPIGDNCWCSKLLIEPAALPKPCPKVREVFDWIQTVNNMIARKVLETFISAKQHCINRMNERLDRLETINPNQVNQPFDLNG